jgi:hypothetical protein
MHTFYYIKYLQYLLETHSCYCKMHRKTHIKKAEYLLTVQGRLSVTKTPTSIEYAFNNDMYHVMLHSTMHL